MNFLSFPKPDALKNFPSRACSGALNWCVWTLVTVVFWVLMWVGLHWYRLPTIITNLNYNLCTICLSKNIQTIQMKSDIKLELLNSLDIFGSLILELTPFSVQITLSQMYLHYNIWNLHYLSTKMIRFSWESQRLYMERNGDHLSENWIDLRVGYGIKAL